MPRAFETEVIQENCPLNGATFADSFSIELDTNLNAREVALRAFSRMPKWVDGLMGLRNIIVAPFGLVRGKIGLKEGYEIVGIFPVIEEKEERILLGLDDKHLDFRILIEIYAGEASKKFARTTTWVKTHNLFGRTYLFSIKPFHKIIVPLALEAI